MPENIEWTPALDELLRAAVLDDKKYGTWGEVAAYVSGRGDVFVSGDAASSRWRRMKEQIDKPPDPEPEAIELGVQPRGQHVGFDIAFWDLETTSLDAWTGFLMVGSIVDNEGNVIHAKIDDFERRYATDDRNLAVWVRDAVETYDIQVTWNGFLFDMGFLNARLVLHDERPLRDMMGIDLRFKNAGGRYGLKIGSSKLKNVAAYFETEHQKPDLPPSVWKKAEHGDPVALATLMDRCDADCLVMRDIFQRVKPMIRTIHR